MPGELIVAVSDLQRERVSVEPVEQLHVVAQADVGELRRVDVAVNESGHQELVLV